MLKFFLFFILFLLLVLIFCPIKIKIKVIGSEEDINIYFYKFKVFSLRRFIKYKHKKQCKEYCEKSSKKPLDEKKRLLKTDYGINVTRLMKALIGNRFKPSLKFSFNLTYSTEDAALTALTYGFIHQVLSLLFLIFDSFFNLKKFSKNIKPEFTDNNSLSFEIEGIITANFAQIIYICFIYLISLTK
ncbi:DUF2953 domain-containing protein [Clostridium perfringens]|nr:DUF2953 domain-containing protein [Clostridium perfringens]